MTRMPAPPMTTKSVGKAPESDREPTDISLRRLVLAPGRSADPDDSEASNRNQELALVRMTANNAHREGRSYSRKSCDALRRRLMAGIMRRWSRSSEAKFRCNGTLPAIDIQRILVCRPNHRLGNTLLLTPLIIELARLLPNATIDVVVGGEAGSEVFQTFPNVRRVYSLSRRMIRHPIAVMRTLLQLRAAGYDLAMDPSEASQSGRLLLTLANAPHAIGVPRNRIGAGALDESRVVAMRSAPAHMAQLPVFLLRNALSTREPATRTDYPPLTIGLTPLERQSGRCALDTLLPVADQRQPPAAIGIFASATGAKVLDKEWWSQFIDELRAHQPGTALVEILPPGTASQFGNSFPTYASVSIRKVAALIANMACFVCADCGVMHLACASGTMTVGLFSATDPLKYAPYGRGSHAINTNGKTPAQVARLVAAAITAGGRQETPDTGLFAGTQTGPVYDAPRQVSHEYSP